MTLRFSFAVFLIVACLHPLNAKEMITPGAQLFRLIGGQPVKLDIYGMTLSVLENGTLVGKGIGRKVKN